jgi:hypothetical protein
MRRPRRQRKQVEAALQYAESMGFDVEVRHSGHAWAHLMAPNGQRFRAWSTPKDADIAEQTHRTRQSVSMLAKGRRGSGDFPPPVAGNVRSPLWHWADVAAWFERYEGGRGIAPDRLRTIAAINGALSSRALAGERPSDLERIREAVLG